MSYLQDMFSKLKKEVGSKDEQKRLVEAEAFSRFASQAYYVTFLALLETKATFVGVEERDYEGLLIANGKRQAYLEILQGLRRMEKIAKERLSSPDDDETETDDD